MPSPEQGIGNQEAFERDLKKKNEVAHVTDAVFGELMRNNVYDYVRRVQDGEASEDLVLKLTPDDVKKLFAMESEGTLPDWSGSNEEADIEELEDAAGLES